MFLEAAKENNFQNKQFEKNIINNIMNNNFGFGIKKTSNDKEEKNEPRD
jgi:hypothetical protein